MFNEDKFEILVESLGFNLIDPLELKKIIVEFCYFYSSDSHFNCFEGSITADEAQNYRSLTHGQAMQLQSDKKSKFMRLLFNSLSYHKDCQDRKRHGEIYSALEAKDKALQYLAKFFDLSSFLDLNKTDPLYARKISDFALCLCVSISASAETQKQPDAAEKWLLDRLTDCIRVVIHKQTRKTDSESGLFDDNTASDAENIQDPQKFKGTSISFESRVLALQRKDINNSIELPNIQGTFRSDKEGLESYYNQWRPYILEETRAEIAARLKFLSDRGEKEIKPFEITISTPPSQLDEENLTVLQIEAESDELPELDHSFALELVKLDAQHNYNQKRFSCWGIVTVKRKQEINKASAAADRSAKFSLRIDLLKEDVNHLYSAFRKGTILHARWLVSLISAQRMDIACLMKPQPSFIEELITGKLTDLPEEDQVSYLQAEHVRDNLNATQFKAVSRFYQADTGAYIISGPPGTGKTTLSITLMKLLTTNKHYRILYSAPSNKAVQESAIRALRDLPSIDIAMTGIAKNLPPELERIFVNEHAERICNSIKKLLKDINSFNDHLQARLAHTRMPDNDKIQTAIQQLEELTNLIQRTDAEISTLESKPQLEVNPRILERFSNLAGSQHGVAADIIQNLNVYREKIINTTGKLRAGKYTAASNSISPGRSRHLQQGKTRLPETTLSPQADIDVLKRLHTALKSNITQYEENLFQERELIEIALLQRSQIVFCTLVSSGRWWLQKNIGQKFDVLIIDEAAQALEPETLIPFIHNPKKLLLIGDTRQLPATVTSKAAKRQGYDESMMGRLEKLKQPFFLLDIQYRMHPAICDFPSTRYYDGRLISAPELTEQRQSPLLGEEVNPIFLKPCVFFNVNGEENRKSNNLNPSISNAKEAEAVIDILTMLLRYLKPHQIGIISYYAAQVSLIYGYVEKIENSRLKQLAKAVQIKTVDGFQGGEKDIIIASTVRTREDCGFLSDERRLNVSITRSRYHLFIVGRQDSLSASKTDFNPMLHHYEQPENTDHAIVDFHQFFPS